MAFIRTKKIKGANIDIAAIYVKNGSGIPMITKFVKKMAKECSLLVGVDKWELE